MKKTTLMAIAIAIAAAGGYFVGQKQTHQPAAAAQPSERKVLYWYDPMRYVHPLQPWQRPRTAKPAGASQRWRFSSPGFAAVEC